MMISCIRYTNRLLAMLSLTASLAIVVSSCNTSDVEIEKPSTGKVTVDLALNVSTQQSTTRLSTGTTQQEASSFRGMQDWTLIPFAPATPLSTPPVSSIDTPLPGVITTPSFDNYRVGDTYNYLDQNVVDAVIGTSAYLCYGKAVRADGTDNFDNGSTVASFDATSYSGGYAPNTITFTPEQICRSEAFNTKGQALLDYLNGIAQAKVEVNGTTHTWSDDSGLDRIFKSLVNLDESETSSPSVYRHFGGSSTNIKALVTKIYNAVAALSFTSGIWQESLQTQILDKIKDKIDQTTFGTVFTIGPTNEITITSLGTDRDGFPANLSLPDGVAVVQWDDTQKAFAYTTYPTSSDAKILRYTDLVYPAELWYYANSPIKTSKSSQASNYNSTNTWNTVLGQYTDGSSVDLYTRSIAITDPLQYGVGCIEAIVQATAARLSDANNPASDISLTRDVNGTTEYNFPLTAVLFGGQYSQNFDFTPNNSGGSHVLYDTKIEGYNNNNGVVPVINLKQGNLSSVGDNDANKFYTLSLQTLDNTEVKIVLEFQNNSGESFYGVDGIIAPGMRFYLVGTVEVPDPLPFSPWRVVTQDCKTQLVINVESLKYAYNVIPDLNTAKNVLKVVDIGVAPWTSHGNEDHNVYNW